MNCRCVSLSRATTSSQWEIQTSTVRWVLSVRVLTWICFFPVLFWISLFPVRLSALRFDLSALDGKVILWLSTFGLLNTLVWLLSLYHGGHLCLIPSELFALAWLPFSLASAPWAANYLGFGFYIRVWRSFFPNIPSELFALTWLPFGLASAPRARRFSCNSKYFWAHPCPFGSPRRRNGMGI